VEALTGELADMSVPVREAMHADARKSFSRLLITQQQQQQQQQQQPFVSHTIVKVA
jgi:hypothetical protein